MLVAKLSGSIWIPQTGHLKVIGKLAPLREEPSQPSDICLLLYCGEHAESRLKPEFFLKLQWMF